MKTKKVNPMYLARLIARDESNHPVVIVTGNKEPELKGHGWYYTTPGGTYIRHPNAYHYRKIYHNSTFHVEVGRNWLHMNRGAQYHKSSDGSLCVIMPKKYHFTIHGIKCIPGFMNKRQIWLVTSKDIEYHASRFGYDEKDARRAIRIVLQDMKRQRKIDKERIEFKAKVKEVYVGINDSIESGNCRLGTEQWGNRNNLNTNKMYRADFILDHIKNGDRSYVERAVKSAFKRHEDEMKQGYCVI